MVSKHLCNDCIAREIGKGALFLAFSETFALLSCDEIEPLRSQTAANSPKIMKTTQSTSFLNFKSDSANY